MQPFLYFLFVSLFIFNEGISQSFSLNGSLEGFDDSTKIIINPYLDDMSIDMDNETLILLMDGKFEFARELDGPAKFSLRVRPQDQDNTVEFEQLTFWAENVPMTLIGTKRKVYEAKITGSEIQDQYFEYIESVSELQNNVKEIADSVKTLNLSKAKKSEMRIRYHKALNAIQEKRWEYIYDHPNYYCTAPELVSAITYFPQQIERKRMANFYHKMPSAYQQNIYGSQIKSFLETFAKTNTPENLEVGDYPYNFESATYSGKKVKFSSINSSVILLDFWASGCGPCRMEHKNYRSLYEKYKNQGFEIVSVSQDNSKSRLLEAMKKDGITWTSLWDEKKRVTKMYNVLSLPTNYLIINGKIVAKNLRGEQLEQKIENYFDRRKE